MPAVLASQLEAILGRLASQLALDADTALANVYVTEGIAIHVLDAPTVALAVENDTLEPWTSAHDWGRADIVFSLARWADRKDPRAAAVEVRQAVARLRQWLIAHRLLGDASGTPLSNLLQGSQVESGQEPTLEDLEEHGLWHVARLRWGIDWLEPRHITTEVDVTQRQVGIEVERLPDGVVVVTEVTAAG